jgi:hypothetical protein
MTAHDDCRFGRVGKAAARDGRPGSVTPERAAAERSLASSGTSPDWGARHDAWQQDRNRCADSPARGKEPLPGAVLGAICESRFASIPAVRAAFSGRADIRLRFSRPRPHVRDAEGRNWTVDALECGDLASLPWQIAVRVELERLRRTFDLA